MNIRFKQHLFIGFLVLFFGVANPVAAVTEAQIALTTEATNEAIVNLEAALKSLPATETGAHPAKATGPNQTSRR
jgi:hypothetical protein